MTSYGGAAANEQLAAEVERLSDKNRNAVTGEIQLIELRPQPHVKVFSDEVQVESGGQGTI